MICTEDIRLSANSEAFRKNVDGAKTWYNSSCSYIVSEYFCPDKEYLIVNIDSGEVVKKCRTRTELRLWLEMLDLDFLGLTGSVMVNGQRVTGPLLVRLS